MSFREITGLNSFVDYYDYDTNAGHYTATGPDQYSFTPAATASTAPAATSPTDSPATASPVATTPATTPADLPIGPNISLGELLASIPGGDSSTTDNALVATGGQTAKSNSGIVVIILLAIGIGGYFLYKKYGRSSN